ncbi:MAG: TonB-dependent receptor plug domain-containing protein [Campylobacterales bacterium]|nr:TonB-dependent receptor plug domain-containing protein [Campylobacterales bacterium]
MTHFRFSAIALLCLSSSLVAADSYLLDTISASESQDEIREDLKPNSPTNPYRVEASAEAGTEVFNQKEIQNLAPKDIYDLLDKAVGIDVTYQGRKSPFFVNDRGGGTLTYIIDGAILPSTSNRILQKIPVSAIEQIEIVRGATTLALGPSIDIGASNSGSGLVTGFVIIRTKQPKKTSLILSGSVEKAVSQPNASKKSAYAGVKAGDSELGGFVGVMASNMDKPSKDTWFDGQNSDSRMATAGFSYKKFSAKIMAYRDSGRFEMQRGVTTTGSIDTSKWYYDPIKTSVVSADATMLWDEHHTTIASMFRTAYSQTEYSNEKFDSNILRVAKNYWEWVSGYSLRHNIHYGSTSVMLGIQQSNNSGFGPNTSNSYNRFDTKVKGYSATLAQGFFDNKLAFDVGYREDKRYIGNSSTSIAKNGANNDVNMAPAKIFAFGGKWKITPTYELSGRYFKGDEGTNGDFDLKTQSGSLDPEKQDRREISLEAKYSKAFKPMVTWFDVNIKNLKTTTTNTYTDTDGSVYYYYGQKDTRRQGVETLIKGTVLGKTSYKVSWTHMLKNESTTNGVVTDNNGYANAEDLYTLALSHEWDSYRANMSVKKETGWSTSTSAMGVATNVPLGDYTRVDANIMKDFVIGKTKGNVTIYGRNLTDENYATRYTTGYYYDRGRTIGAQLTLEF